jgi:DNA-binding transcriptional ArsR family regulator
MFTNMYGDVFECLTPEQEKCLRKYSSVTTTMSGDTMSWSEKEIQELLVSGEDSDRPDPWDTVFELLDMVPKKNKLVLFLHTPPDEFTSREEIASRARECYGRRISRSGWGKHLREMTEEGVLEQGKVVSKRRSGGEIAGHRLSERGEEWKEVVAAYFESVDTADVQPFVDVWRTTTPEVYLGILDTLAGEESQPVQEVGERFDERYVDPVPNLSYHMRNLGDYSFIDQKETEGRSVAYKLTEEGEQLVEAVEKMYTGLVEGADTVLEESCDQYLRPSKTFQETYIEPLMSEETEQSHWPKPEFLDI